MYREDGKLLFSRSGRVRFEALMSIAVNIIAIRDVISFNAVN
jgi:hypothetical protein